MNKDERFSKLLAQYLEGCITPEDTDELFNLLSSDKHIHILQAFLTQDALAPNNDDIPAPPNTSTTIVRKILNQAAGIEKVNSPIKREWSWPGKFIVAASLGLLIAIGVYLYVTPSANSFITAFKQKSTRKVHNHSDTLQQVIMPDGSRITLNRGSELYYFDTQFGKKREVYLEGEAKFEIARNTKSPFYVYYGKVVTKVLGTSFNVKTNKTTGDVEVEVLSGKVQLYENDYATPQKQAVTKLTVTPNQKAVYNIQNQRLRAVLVDSPLPLKHEKNFSYSNQSSSANKIYLFDNVRIARVLSIIQNDYGIEIVAKDDQFNEMIFNGDISKQDLFDKLNIICTATNSYYKIIGTKILIKNYDE